MQIRDANTAGCIPREEWDFDSNEPIPMPNGGGALYATERLPAEWQGIPMINYEYARSFRPVVQAVRDWRERKTFVPLFARYLAKTFPEFPKTPWLQIDPAKRIQRMEAIGITNQTTWPEQAPPIQFWSAYDPEVEELKRELVLREQDCLRTVKINFNYKDEVIGKALLDHVVALRRHLLKKHNHEIECADGKIHNENKYFKPKKIVKQGGGASVACQWKLYLKELGALRVMRFYGDKVSLAEDATCDANGENPLYSGSKAWRRASDHAAMALRRFAVAWTCMAFPVDIFDWPQLIHQVGVRGCGEPLPTSDEITQQHELRAFVERDFIGFNELFRATDSGK